MFVITGWLVRASLGRAVWRSTFLGFWWTAIFTCVSVCVYVYRRWRFLPKQSFSSELSCTLIARAAFWNRTIYFHPGPNPMKTKFKHVVVSIMFSSTSHSFFCCAFSVGWKFTEEAPAKGDDTSIPYTTWPFVRKKRRCRGPWILGRKESIFGASRSP